MSDLVRKPEDCFSRGVAHLVHCMMCRLAYIYNYSMKPTLSDDGVPVIMGSQSLLKLKFNQVVITN